MGNLVFNIARGRFRTLFEGASASTPVIVVLFKSIEADTVLQDYDTLALIKASGGNVECDFTNYARKNVTSGVTANVDDSANTMTIAFPSQTWTAAGGATNNAVVKLITCYKPSTSAADSACIPLTMHDYVTTTDGTDRVVNTGAAGIYRSS